MENVNKIIIQGPIVRLDANDIATNVRIKVRRENLPNSATEKTREGESFYNQPEVSFYNKELKDKVAKEFKPGDEVKIIGYTSVTKKLSKVTNEDFYDQKIIGVEIAPAVTVVKEQLGIDVPGDTAEQYCRFIIAGEIVRTTPLNGVAVINIRTMDNGVNNIQTSAYVSNAEKYLENYSVKDNVTAIGTIQTLQKKNKDGKPVFRRNYVITGIKKED